MCGRASFRRFAVVLVLAFFLAGAGPVFSASEGGGPGEPAAHSAKAEGHEGVSQSKVWDLVSRALNFAVLFLVIFFLLRKPLSQLVKDRREGIAQTLAELEDKKVEVEKRFEDLGRKLAEIDGERAQIIAEALKEGEAEKEKIIAHAHELSTRIKDQAQISIRLEINKAKEELKKEISDLSASMAEDLLKKNMTEQDQARLVDEYLDKVVES